MGWYFQFQWMWFLKHRYCVTIIVIAVNNRYANDIMNKYNIILYLFYVFID